MDSSFFLQSYFVITNFRIENVKKQQEESEKVCIVILTTTVFITIVTMCYYNVQTNAVHILRQILVSFKCLCFCFAGLFTRQKTRLSEHLRGKKKSKYIVLTFNLNVFTFALNKIRFAIFEFLFQHFCLSLCHCADVHCKRC